MICEHCGKSLKIHKSNKFCEYCGQNIEEQILGETKKGIAEKVKELCNVLELLTSDLTIPRQKRLNIIIHATSILCAIIAVQPIPFADIFILTPIQVIMVTQLSRVLDKPIGKDNAKEVISYIIGVVGWGVLAQQAVLGLYKTVIPFMGAFTTIPLVYASTYSLGYAAKTILIARESDQKVTDDQIRKIADHAKKEAQKENDLSLAGIKAEWEKLKKQAVEYATYQDNLLKMELDCKNIENC